MFLNMYVFTTLVFDHVSMMLVSLFIFGLFIGSFINVLADRLPRGEDVLTSRSHCDHCKHKLRWYELIPLLSFFLQRGKTRCCHKTLSIQYPLSELITGSAFVILSILPFPHGFSFQPLFLIPYSLFLILFSSLLVIFISDLKYEIIPMEMIITGFLTVLCFHFINFTNLMNFTNFLFSALGAGGFFWCLWFFSKGKAMGDGDIYLASLLGFSLGFPNIIISLYAAFLTGAVVGVILILQRKKGLKSHIPFGPFLILGYGITLVWGEPILRIWRLLW